MKSLESDRYESQVNVFRLHYRVLLLWIGARRTNSPSIMGIKEEFISSFDLQILVCYP